MKNQNKIWRIIILIIICISNLLYYYIKNKDDSKIVVEVENRRVHPESNKDSIVHVIKEKPFDLKVYCENESLDYDMILAISESENFKKSKMDMSEFVNKSGIPEKTYVGGYVAIFGDESIHDLYNTYYRIHKRNIQ